jgi:hypothetical protein
MPHEHAAQGSTGAIIAAMALIILLATQTTAVAGLAAASRLYAARTVVWGLFWAVLGGAAFQVLHVIEHVAQFGYWVAHPTKPPWMTPWAMVLMHGFADLGGPSPLAFGTELLHLVGNSIFFVGVVTLLLLVRIVAPHTPTHRTTRLTLWVQGFHVAEHVLLTLTFLWFGRAAGVSTFFGLVGPGPVLWTYRVWWHFVINAVATVLLLKALREFWPEWNRRRDADLLSGWAAMPGAFVPAYVDDAKVPAHAVPSPVNGNSPAHVMSGPAHAAPQRVAAFLNGMDRVRVFELLVRVVRAVCAAAITVLSLHVLFVVLDANPDNWMVGMTRGLADAFVLSFRDLFIPDSAKLRVVINYGLAALAYLAARQAVTGLRLPSRQDAGERSEDRTATAVTASGNASGNRAVMS